MGYGGAPVVVKNITDNYESEQVEAYVCALRTNPKAIPLETKQFNLRYGRYNPCSILAIAKLCRQYDIDIVHAHLQKSIVSSLLASFFCSSRIIIHEHGAIFRGGTGFIYRFLLKILGWRAARAIAVSQATKAALQRVTGLSDEQVGVVYNAVDFARFERLDYDREESRRALGISDDKTVVGFVGRLDRCKGADLLLDGAAKLLKGSDDYHFVVVGDGAERERLVAQSRKLGLESNVTFTGLLTNPAEVISAFDIAVVPSRREAFGITAVEFMRMGVPVIASGVGGLPELVRNGETGILLESLSAEQIADAVSKLAGDDLLREKLTSNAQTFSRQFDVANQGEKIVGIYKTVDSSG
jgi:glycosyltransferase involved in cell wall biosynthesis